MTMDQGLDACSREPIHIPGSIQPFGVLLAGDDRFEVSHCSANVAAAFGRSPDELL